MDRRDRIIREVTPCQNEGSFVTSATDSVEERIAGVVAAVIHLGVSEGAYNCLPCTTEYVGQDCTDGASPGKGGACGGSGKA